jgi:hypothetical protein
MAPPAIGEDALLRAVVEGVESPEPPVGARSGTPETLDEIERRHVVTTLERTGWRIEGSRLPRPRVRLDDKRH